MSPLEFWYTIAQIAGVVVLAATLVVAFITVLLGFHINKINNEKMNAQAEKIAELTAESAKANKATEELKIETAKAKEKQAEAEAKLLELQERLQPRKLSNRQISTLKDILQKHPGGRLTIEFAALDSESHRFAQQIESVLLDASWEASVGSRIGIEPSPVGMVLMVREGSKKINPFETALLEAFAAAELNVRTQPSRYSMYLHVGVHPGVESA